MVYSCQDMNLAREPLPEFISTQTAAKKLGVTQRTIYRYIKEEGLPVIYLSTGAIRIPWDQFILWIDQRPKGGEKVKS